ADLPSNAHAILPRVPPLRSRTGAGDWREPTIEAARGKPSSKAVASHAALCCNSILPSPSGDHPMPNRKTSEAERDLVDTARRVLPAGTFGNVPHEVVIARGQGGHVWDVSGNEYVDFLLGSGPMLIGHAHPEVGAVVQEQLAN